MEWILDPHPVKLAMCGNRAGKTEPTAFEVVCRTTGIQPPCLPHRLPGPVATDQKPLYWVCSALNSKMSETIQKTAIRKFLPTYLIDREDRVLNLIYLKNESIIDFRSCEAGVEKYQGFKCDGAWEDEEHDERVHRELRIRLIDNQGWMAITMTAQPEKGITWTWDALVEPGKKGEVGLHNWATWDNPYLSPETIAREAREMTPIQYRCRVLGEMTAAGGTNPFGEDVIEKMAQDVHKPLWREGDLMGWADEEDLQGHDFTIGCDPSEGLGLDASVAVVLDRDSGDEVAELTCASTPPDAFARRLATLGERFGGALLCPERNNHGAVVINELRALHYPRIYTQSRYDQRAKTTSKTLGYLTTRRSKALLIDNLSRMLRDRSVIVRSAECRRELSTFLQTEEGMGARTGCHDDRVMALALAAMAMMDRGGITPCKPLPERVRYRRTWNDVARSIEERDRLWKELPLWR